MHGGRTQTNTWPADAGSELELSDALGRRRLKCYPSSRTGENPPSGMIGGSEEGRPHSKSGPRLDPTRLRVPAQQDSFLMPVEQLDGAVDVEEPWLAQERPLLAVGIVPQPGRT